MEEITNTFTKNLKGDIQPDFLEFAQRTEKKLKEIIQEYVQDCFDRQIDSCASDGFFLSIVASELAMYRSKLLYEEYRKTGDRHDD